MYLHWTSNLIRFCIGVWEFHLTSQISDVSSFFNCCRGKWLLFDIRSICPLEWVSFHVISQDGLQSTIHLYGPMFAPSFPMTESVWSVSNVIPSGPSITIKWSNCYFFIFFLISAPYKVIDMQRENTFNYKLLMWI